MGAGATTTSTKFWTTGTGVVKQAGLNREGTMDSACIQGWCGGDNQWASVEGNIAIGITVEIVAFVMPSVLDSAS